MLKSISIFWSRVEPLPGIVDIPTDPRRIFCNNCFENVILVKLVQPIKHSEPNLSTVKGNVISLNLLQNLKQLFLISVKLLFSSSKTTSCKFSQF